MERLNLQELCHEYQGLAVEVAALIARFGRIPLKDYAQALIWEQERVER